MILFNRETIERSLDRRLPEIRFLTESSEIIQVAIRLVDDAEKFIYMTGSATRNKRYLERIEGRVMQGVRHARILYERHTKPELEEHLFRVIDERNVEIFYADEAHHGYFTINESEALLVLPGRIYEESIAIHFVGEKRVSIIIDQFNSLAKGSVPIKSHEQLSKVIEDVAKFGN